MSRWIDGDWLLNFFEPYPDDYQTPLGTLRACVDDAPSIEPKQEWIPCSERLPKIGEVVLVTWEWGCKKYITVAYMVTIRSVTYWDSKQQHEFKPLNVIAWMPLPKPWKGADNE